MNSKELIKQAEKSLTKEFEQIEDIRDFNQEKVLNAFIENKVAPEHFYTVSGYDTSCSIHPPFQESLLLLLIHSCFQTYFSPFLKIIPINALTARLLILLLNIDF